MVLRAPVSWLYTPQEHSSQRSRWTASCLPVIATHCPAEVVKKVNELIATGQYGRLFAVVHFASRQWKVTAEDLILIENELDIKCGERIRLEKVRCTWCCGLGDSGTQ